MVYSASMVPAQMNEGNSEHYYIRHLMFIILGFALVFFMTYFMSGNFFKMKGVQLIMLIGIIILLLITMFFGTEVNGQRNWISFGPFGLQSSGFFKVVSLLYLASIYSMCEKRISSDDSSSILLLLFILFLW